MKDFRNYTPGENDNGGKHTRGESAKGTSNGASGTFGAEQTVNLAAAIAKACNGKSEGQIWQTILLQAEQGKRNGTLTNADLDNFYNAVAPLVDGFKRQKLRQIIAKLKAI